MSPEKGEGALPAPIPLIQSPTTRTQSAQAQACEHRATVTKQEPPGATHFSREICLECGAFVRWLPKPSTIERRTLNSFCLARLGMCEGLSDWERRFVRDVSKRRKLSPRQQALVERLCEGYLGGQNAMTRPTETETARKGHYEPIVASFKYDGFNYRQIAREGDVAIYEQRWIRPGGDLSENVCYEVIRVQRHEAHTFPSGKSYPPREGYPSSEQWGEDGWTLLTRDAAFAKLRELLSSPAPPGGTP
jgi:hypothetical protein